MNIVLIGFMATGKTIIGKRLAGELNMDFFDTDLIIEKKEKKKIARIFSESGEDYFRKVEKDIIKRVSRKNNAVISTGGGSILFSKNMTGLKKSGIIICLKSSPEVILKRIKKQKGIRPLLNRPNPLKEIRYMLKKRAYYYKKADFSIYTSNFDLEKIIVRIKDKISGFRKDI